MAEQLSSSVVVVGVVGIRPVLVMMPCMTPVPQTVMNEQKQQRNIGAAILLPSTRLDSTIMHKENGIGANAHGTAIIMQGSDSISGKTSGHCIDNALPTQVPMKIVGKICPPM